MATRTSENLTATIASGDTLDVRSFEVEEGLSKLFTVRLTVVCDNADIDFEAVAGQDAGFVVHGRGGKTRTITGVASTMTQLEVEESGLSTYYLEIVPRLWLTTQRRNHRMFQRISEPDIVKKLLDEWGVAYDDRLTQTYKKRKYRVQYAETDFAFLNRMLEDAGIAYFFEDGSNKVVLTDAPHKAEARDPALRFYDEPGDVDVDWATVVRVSRKVRPGKYTMRDHDYRRPPSFNLKGTATGQDNAGIEAQLERFHYTPGAFLFEDKKGEDTPHADDKGKYRTDEAVGNDLAQARLHAKRSEARSVTFETNCVDIQAGTVLSFVGHPHSALGKPYLVNESSLRGTSDGDWAHHCEARVADVPYRPRVDTPKPKVVGVESATVVGPPGEEIHTDEFGRVRVHFHWDRESGMNDDSSCWIHVSQPWGGAGFGGTNLPRIGQEVIVDFLGGDPDRPIITGRVYTNLQKTPYKLPAGKTQSGWKSNSTGKTGGYNELMFEDSGGNELFRMQAEKDMQTLVKNDESHTVLRDRTRYTKRNESSTIGKNLTKVVVANESETTGQNRSMMVGMNRSAQIGLNDSVHVGVSYALSIAAPAGAASSTPTTQFIEHDKIVLATPGGASITLERDTITLKAKNIWGMAEEQMGMSSMDQATFAGFHKATLGSGAGTALVNGRGKVEITGGTVQINGPGLPAGRVLDPAPATIVRGSSTVLIGGAQTARDITRAPNGDILYGTAIVIHGPPEFQAQALSAVARLDNTPSMHAAFDAMEASGHTQTIIPYVPPPGWGPYNAYCQPMGLGNTTPGVGCDSTVAWDPNVNGFGPPGTTPDSEQPGADVILAHEMIHGTHNATGTAGNGPRNGDGVNISEERNTVGLPSSTYNHPGNPGDPSNGTVLPDTTGLPYTENSVREELGDQGYISPVTGQEPVPRVSYYHANADGTAGLPF